MKLKLPSVCHLWFYEFQYAKYVRRLPFFLVRHYGAKKLYKPKAVDAVLRKYGFNIRYSPVAYALVCRAGDYEVSSSRFQPCPTREYIRQRVAGKYFRGNEAFQFVDLMKMSIFKSNWSGSGQSANEEYWTYMAKFDDQGGRA